MFLEKENGSAFRKFMSIQRNDLTQRRRALVRRRHWVWAGALLGCFLLSLASLLLGAARIPLNAIASSLWAGIHGFVPEGRDGGWYAVIWDIRLPRLVMGAFAGAALASGGTAMQGVLRNPLASPYTLGISAAAAFGASFAIVVGFPSLVVLFAFLSALLSLSLVLFFAWKGRMRAEGLILSGIAVMYVFSAGTSLLQYLATHDQLAKIVFWLMGSLSSTTWNHALIVALVTTVVLPCLYGLSWQLNVLTSGEEEAQSLGTDPRKIRGMAIVLVTLMTAVVVSYTGVIGFIGLAGPHIARLLFGSDHRIALPSSALFGAALLIFSDTMSRTVLGNTEIPVGIMTSLVGVPVLVSILAHRQRTNA